MVYLTKYFTINYLLQPLLTYGGNFLKTFPVEYTLLFLLLQNPLLVAEQLYIFDNDAPESSSYIRRRHRFWNKTSLIFLWETGTIHLNGFYQTSLFASVNIMWIVDASPFHLKINKDRTRPNGTEHTLSISLTHHRCSKGLNTARISMGTTKLFYSCLITTFFNSYFLTMFIAWELLEIFVIFHFCLFVLEWFPFFFT